MSSNPSTKHHFIPAFYLRRWECESSGKLTEYTNPYQNKFATRAVTAERTGWEDRLYELKGFQPALAQQVEEKFFKSIDTQASDALALLEAHGHQAPWDSRSRSAWSRFILSLLLRCPEDIALFREWWHEDFSVTDAEAEARYLATRKPDNPKTFSEYLAGRSLAEKEQYQFEMLFSLIDHENVGSRLNEMYWRVLQTLLTAPSLLTSDRPVIRTPLGDDDGHMVLPVGPRLLWIAGNDANFLERIRLADPVGLVKEINRQVVEGASRYVWGVDADHLRFVQNRFGRNPQPRVMRDIVARRRLAAAAR